jgi:hypothetical protein
MSSDVNFVATGPSPFGFRAVDGEGFDIEGRRIHIEVGASLRGLRIGVEASSDGAAVVGASEFADGVVGSSNNVGKSGVFGFHGNTSGAAFGVSANVNSPDGAAVNGFSDPGVGVKGASRDNNGVVGSTSVANRSGVFGFSLAQFGPTFGVSGATISRDGAGVHGFTDQGYGGSFSGARAPLRLVPANTAGRPTTGNHQMGEFVVDANGDLFYCKEDGAPGKWFRVQLTPA